MKWSQSLIPTQKEIPTDAQIISHQLMLRAGLIRQVTAGAYDFLPLGLRALNKAAQIVRQEMDRAGCAEVQLPILQPLELWQKTGRDVAYGENLFKFKDRHGRLTTIAPTAEEVVTELVAGTISSYKQLPLILYQIGTKFRDEYRPRFGLLRVREFLMKDAYSFHSNLAQLDEAYESLYAAYERIFQRCGVPYVVVEAEAGPIGGSASHEFMTPCDAGEDVLLFSDKNNYAANVEKAETGHRSHDLGGAPTGELEKAHTPDLPSIDEVGKFMKVKSKNMLKTLVFQAQGNPTRWVMGVVRGDHDINEAKIKKAAREKFGVESLALVDTPEVRSLWPIGFVSPRGAIGRNHTVILVDPDAAQGGFWATGADEIDYHIKHFNWQRELGAVLNDAEKFAVADIRNAQSGDPSPKNDGGVLQSSRGIEIGHVFKLGTKYTVPLGAMFTDETGREQPIIMGTYGIGVGRILLAAVETGHDDKGIIWPSAIAPYQVVITPIKYEGQAREVADQLHDQLNAVEIDCILDDRDARPGFKFADADLIGFPVRITLGERGLKEGQVEIKKRTQAEAQLVPVAQVVQFVQDLLLQHG
ncbi:MAG: proline--tRNA ligase [Phycisphaerales bacterium]|nr:proline--tRNA ligase [Phycisphaerales bacterium]